MLYTYTVCSYSIQMNITAVSRQAMANSDKSDHYESIYQVLTVELFIIQFMQIYPMKVVYTFPRLSTTFGDG